MTLVIKILNKKTILIVALFMTLLFIIMQLFIPPYIGLANNGDFERASRKVGLDYPYNAWAKEYYKDSFFAYMMPTFQEVEPQSTDFFSTSEIVVSIAKVLNKSLNIYHILGQFDIRCVGLVLFLIYMLAISLIFFYIRTFHTAFIIGISCFACLFFSDILVTQYFNTFYGEATGFVFFIVIMAFSLLLLPQYKQEKRTWITPLFIVIEIIASYMFIFAKFQYILFSIPLSFLFAVQIIGQQHLINKNNKREILVRRIILFMAVCSIPFSLLVTSSLYSETSSSYITSANIILQDMLDLSESPETHLEAMGFSLEEIEVIKPNIGKNTFLANDDFAKILHIVKGEKFNRPNQINMIFREPSILFNLIARKSNSLFTAGQMGTFQKSYGLPPYARDSRFSLLSKINNVLFLKSFKFFAIVLLISVCASSYFIVKQKSWLIYNPHHILLCLNLMCFLQYVTIIFGDSSHDAVKHFFFVNILFILIFYTTILLLLYRFLHWLYKRPAIKMTQQKPGSDPIDTRFRLSKNP